MQQTSEEKAAGVTQHNAKVSPVRSPLEWSDKEQSFVRRVVAYRAECSCGYRSAALRSYGAAQTHKRSHLIPVR